MRSSDTPGPAGPAASVFPADHPRGGAQADLLRMWQDQGGEISRASAAFTVMMLPKKAPARGGRGAGGGAAGGGGGTGDTPEADAATESTKPKPKPKPEPRTFPAGSYVVRMDQP